ncbi:class I SAM-dependent methyltransferase [Candidatus Nitrosopelagicus sp.]|nr:class I SAM-dependent methyltransferase [Candidatus Nitrosopelagicus sp.]
MDNEIWDDMARDYDKSVEDNQDAIIVNYIKKEIEILTTLCNRVYDSNKNCSIIDMGAGTGRVIFALDEKLQGNSIKFYGVEVSEPMLNYANQKKQNHEGISKIEFLKFDLTNVNLSEYFQSGETNIVMCLYNTLGVISSDKRQKFIDNMKKIAGKKGLTILTAFNGDDFGFVAPKLYNPMMPMIKQIDQNSFDETNRVFQNDIGFRSQWFTKNELKSMLDTNVEPIPINVTINDTLHTFGNVFIDRNI